MRLVRVPTPARPALRIALDRAGRPWIVLFGTNKIATVDPETFALTEYPLPRAEARPPGAWRSRPTAPSGTATYAGGMLGRFDPQTKKVEEWPLPGGAGGAALRGHRGRSGPDLGRGNGVAAEPVRGFDTRTHRFLPGADVPSGGGTIRNMVFDPHARAIWFGSDANTIGRAQLPAVPATPVP